MRTMYGLAEKSKYSAKPSIKWYLTERARDQALENRQKRQAGWPKSFQYQYSKVGR